VAPSSARRGAAARRGHCPGQPVSAAFTAAIRHATSTRPPPVQSKAVQFPSGCVPSAMPTPVTSSLTLMSPLPSQSPAHGDGGAVTVAVAVGNAGVIVGRGTVAVWVAGAVAVGGGLVAVAVAAGGGVAAV